MEVPLRYELAEIRARMGARNTVLVIVGAAIFCAIELSPWGHRHFDIRPLPVLAITMFWVVQVAYQAWLLDTHRAISKSFFVVSILAQQALCAIHGTASTHVASAPYILGPLGAMALSQHYRPQRWIYALVILIVPVFRLALFPRVDTGLLVASFVGIANAFVFYFASRDEDTRRPLTSTLDADVAWARELRSRPGMELSMLLHDHVSGQLLLVQDRLKHDQLTPSLQPLIELIVFDLETRTQRSHYLTAEEIRAMVEELARLLDVHVTIAFTGGIRYEELPIAMRNDVVAVVREALTNAVRHTDVTGGIHLELRCDRTVATCMVSSGAARGEGGRSAKRGLRNLMLRAQSWSGDAALERSGNHSRLRVSLHRFAPPRWTPALVGVAACFVATLMSLVFDRSGATLVLTSAFLGYWVLAIAATHSKVRSLIVKSDAARAERQAVEQSLAEEVQLALRRQLEAMQSALQQRDVAALRVAVDSVADALGTVMADLENRATAAAMA